MASDELARCQKQSLHWRIHGRVGGLKNYMEAFKVYPHRVRRIGHPTVGKRIGRQKKAEFIVDEGKGYWQER